MNKLGIVLLVTVHRVLSMSVEDAEIERARKSACYFIKHTPSGCTLTRKFGCTQLKACKHDKCLAENLKLNTNISIFYFFNEQGEQLDCPFFFVNGSKDDSKDLYERFYQDACNTLNPDIKPKVSRAEIIKAKEGTLTLVLYDQRDQCILEIFCVHAMFEKFKQKISLSKQGQQQLASLVDVTQLKEIKDKTGICCLV